MTSKGYRIELEAHPGNVEAFHDDQLLVKSENTVVLRETRLPDCYYFPLDDVKEGILEPSHHRTFCPFKGTASYWHLNLPNKRIENGAWSYMNPLKESSGLENRLAFGSDLISRVDFQHPPRQPKESDGHINSPLSDWVLREAGFIETRRDLVHALAQKFLEAGIDIYRMSITIWSLHPQIAGVNFLWNRETNMVTVSGASYEVFKSPAYLNSPLNYVTKGQGGVRQPLDTDEMEFQFPIIKDLKKEGATDYVAMPLRFSDGQNHTLTMASNHPGGFTTENLGLIFECVGVISRYLEVLTLRRNAVTILDTYLGRRTGARVLNGDIRRGQGENIQSVILFSDLRNSTLLAEQLPRNEYLTLLDRYFETVIGPINRHGGEVLKFIGDAVLAIFPIADDNDTIVQAQHALTAAREIIGSLNSGDQIGTEKNPQEYAFDLGTSLHIGEVTYGNVGGQDRLDFTVIGSAVNLASRLENLCKSSGRKIILSKEFRDVIDKSKDNTASLIPVGTFEFEGISGKREVYSLAETT